MPPSTKPETNFITITSTDSTGGQYDSCAISLTSHQPNNFTSATISQAIVQSTSALTFNLQLSTPLLVNDEVHLTFPNGFDLAGLPATSSIPVTGFNNFALTKIGSLVKLRSNLVQFVLKPPIVFTLSNIGIPFTTAPSTIQISVLSFDNYMRID